MAIKKPLAKKPSPVKKPMSTGAKVALGAAAAVGAVGLGIAGAKIAKKVFGGKTKRSSVQKLQKQIKVKTLKIKNIQLSRKLFKEQLKTI